MDFDRQGDTKILGGLTGGLAVEAISGVSDTAYPAISLSGFTAALIFVHFDVSVPQSNQIFIEQSDDAVTWERVPQANIVGNSPLLTDPGAIVDIVAVAQFIQQVKVGLIDWPEFLRFRWFSSISSAGSLAAGVFGTKKQGGV